MEVKLYVGNLAYSTTEADLRMLFAQAGNVAADRPVEHALHVRAHVVVEQRARLVGGAAERKNPVRNEAGCVDERQGCIGARKPDSLLSFPGHELLRLPGPCSPELGATCL